MRWRALPLAALIGCTAAAPQLAASDCVLTGGETFSEAPVDVRDGVVSWVDGSGAMPDWPGLTRRTILDCRTNAAMQLNVTRNTGPLGTRDVTQEVSAWLYSVPEGPRLNQIKAGLGAMGVGLTEAQFAGETCACAAYYPDLRGDKPAYGVAT